MVYLGRIEAGGLTKEGREAVLHAVTARSVENKIRVVEIYPSRVFINSPLFKKSYEELTEQEKEILRRQQEQAKFIFYNGITVLNAYLLAIAGNGAHTDSIVRRYRDSLDNLQNVIRRVLNRWGPELDGPDGTPQTPRISVISEVGSEQYTLGIISRPNEAKTFVVEVRAGVMQGLSTYTGDSNDRKKMVINHNPSVITLPSEGRTAQQLADDLFDWLDRELVVCTAAAVWDPKRKRWEFGKRDFYQ